MSVIFLYLYMVKKKCKEPGAIVHRNKVAAVVKYQKETFT